MCHEQSHADLDDAKGEVADEGLVIKNKAVRFTDHEENGPAKGEEEEVKKGEVKPHIPLLHRRSTFLQEGEDHKVHVPLTVVPVDEDGEEEEEKVVKPSQRQRKVSIWERQKTLHHRVEAVREVLKEVDIEEELADGEEEEEDKEEEGHSRSRDLWKMAAKRVAAKVSVLSELKRNVKKADTFHHAVNSLLLQQKEHGRTSAESSAVPAVLKKRSTINEISRQLSGQHLVTNKPFLVPIAKWKELVRTVTASMDEAEPVAAQDKGKSVQASTPGTDVTDGAGVQPSLSPDQVVVVATIEKDGAHLDDKGLNATDLHGNETCPQPNGPLQARGTSRRHLVKEPNLDETTHL